MELNETMGQLLSRAILFRQGPETLLGRLTAPKWEDRQAALSELVSIAAKEGWQGNLWHCCLTQALAESENPFSRACERRPAPADSLWELALEDMELFYSLFALELNEGPWELLRRFRVDRAREDGQRMKLTETLEKAATPRAMLEGLCAFYRDRGVGLLGLGQVFRAEEKAGGARLFPVEDRPDVRLDDLVGYEKQKEQLRNNTLAFLKGGRGNNVLLYGDAGTGKSTSIQAIVNEYAPEGLRLIEVYKDQYELIPDILRQVKGRNYRFILFLDDLSFEENETAYKYLKAVMEGGAEAAPENVRIYATSNRRHLVREMWNDRTDMEHDGDIHRSDTMEEKLSLASRFGLQIFYPAPTFEEYQGIVSALALRGGAGSKLTPAQLRAAAATWQVRSGSRSGRTARQFIDALDT